MDTISIAVQLPGEYHAHQTKIDLSWNGRGSCGGSRSYTSGTAWPTEPPIGLNDPATESGSESESESESDQNQVVSSGPLTSPAAISRLMDDFRTDVSRSGNNMPNVVPCVSVPPGNPSIFEVFLSWDTGNQFLMIQVSTQCRTEVRIDGGFGVVTNPQLVDDLLALTPIRPA